MYLIAIHNNIADGQEASSPEASIDKLSYEKITIVPALESGFYKGGYLFPTRSSL